MASKKSSGETDTGPHVRAGNDAFGKHSPHWNLPFPVGRITASEILAYCPHWLKSVDVVDRFVSNGGKSKIIGGMLTRFRILPLAEISANSVCVMMQCAMRAAGFTTWTTSEHKAINETRAVEWDTTDLDVSSFRAPYVTHPKKGSKKIENVPAEHIEFLDLAKGVKEHPSGDDALDLTRCVLYAMDNPHESWRFPVDFERLMTKLGGPQPTTHYHLDTQAFKRAVVELFPPAERKKLAVTPLTKRVRFADTNTIYPMRKSDMRLAPPKATTTKKRGYEEVDAIAAPKANAGSKRRSGRIATQAAKSLREPDIDTGTADNTPYYQNDDTYGHTQKKRKTTRASSVESDFIANDMSDSENLPDAHDEVSDDLLSPQPTSRRPTRASAQRSRRLTRQTLGNGMPKAFRSAKGTKSFTQIATEATTAHGAPRASAQTLALKQHPVPDYLIDPALRGQARAWETHRPEPIRATAPLANPNRIVVDEYNIWLYAEEGCCTHDEMWASALSSTRFNGPRKHAPFRELYRLTDPMPCDSSDWAENIRWAKQQHIAFGIKSWLEYDDHLEQITQLRRETMWVSEETATGGVILRY